MDCIELPIQPLSINQVNLTGEQYAKWSEQVYRMLPPLETLTVDFTSPMAMHIDASFSNGLSTSENIWKPLLDVMKKAYPEFNDNLVFEMSASGYVTEDQDEVGYIVKMENLDKF